MPIPCPLVRGGTQGECLGSCSFAPFVAVHHLPEVGLRFNVVLIFAVFKIFLHNGKNPLNCSEVPAA